VQVTCNDGTKGIGFSYIGTGGGLSAASAFNEFVIPTALGHDPTKPEDLIGQLRFITRIQGRGGIVVNALSALDIALWDRNARAQDLPLSKFINSSAKSIVPAYYSGGYLSCSDERTDLDAEIKTALDAGFDSIKLKCAFDVIDKDLERIAEARSIIGPDRQLMLDAYNRWQLTSDAVPYVKGYQEFHPYWIEDPFEPDLIDEMKELNEEVPSRLATGEFYFGILPFRQMAKQGAVRVFQAEAPRCGGITDWLKIAEIAKAANIEMSPCWFHDLHVHLVAATPVARFVEYFPTYDILNFGLLIDNPVVAEGGSIRVPQEPGLGFQFKETAIEQFSLGDAIEASVADITVQELRAGAY
jgi:L-alanine-DL-glutamate epimerase-like enolase superfamily enzyme